MLRAVILSDRSLREQLAAGRIVIDPFDDSLVQPSSLSDPAHGTTLSASGAGNGESSPSASTALRTSPAVEPSDGLPATAASSACRRSMPAWPAPDAAW